MTTPIFILDIALRNVGLQPADLAAVGLKHDDAPIVDWTSICHGQRGKLFFTINHEAGRSPSRWTYVANKRPWIVSDRWGTKYGASSTLDGALKIARRVRDEHDELRARLAKPINLDQFTETKPA